MTKYRIQLSIVVVVLSVHYYFCLPTMLFDDPYSTVLNDRDGKLLSARIADDGQWRFPETVYLPGKYERALLTFEDQYYYRHPGVNPLAIGRAVVQNLKEGRVVSGGSTISMQVIRLSRKGKSRNAWQKIIEMVQATRLELRYSKKEILNLYASHAPFGSNTVGLSAASWRYFQRTSDELSWAEAALLAVLPNQPALLFPGKNEGLLKAKRDRLLDRLFDQGEFDSITLELAKSEPLPLEPQDLPQLTQHLMNRSSGEGFKGKIVNTTINRSLQERVDRIVNSHGQLLKANGVNNAAALILNVKTGTVESYVGNLDDHSDEHGSRVDVIGSPRSTGSLLKPILYAAMLDEGLILPNSLVPDVPMSFGQFAPKNFSRTYDGAIGAKMAVARSLNMPAVHMLQQYGYPKFHSKLRKMGMSTLNKPPGHYGLTLVLGGSEGTLWDMANMYAGMARTLNNYHSRPYRKRYSEDDFEFSDYQVSSVKSQASSLKEEVSNYKSDGVLSAASIWFAFEAMLEVYRPAEDASWKLFNSSKKIAWKTGTSFGHRDAWAIGVTPNHVVAVWAGNADGEGRPGLTGINAAAPILFDVFDLLPDAGWFVPPMQELTYAVVDQESGYLASQFSDKVDTVLIPAIGLRTQVSPFHQRVHLDITENFRVTGDCETVNAMVHKNWFVLPPKQAVYYKLKNPTYQELPPYRNDCYQMDVQAKMMEVVYPDSGAELYLPVDIDGSMGEMVFEVAHRDPNSQLYWHIDDNYIGSTMHVHELSFRPQPGKHILTITDDRGNAVQRVFNILAKQGD